MLTKCHQFSTPENSFVCGYLNVGSQEDQEKCDINSFSYKNDSPKVLPIQ
jgi:hypothetical protein